MLEFEIDRPSSIVATANPRLSCRLFRERIMKRATDSAGAGGRMYAKMTFSSDLMRSSWCAWDSWSIGVPLIARIFCVYLIIFLGRFVAQTHRCQQRQREQQHLSSGHIQERGVHKRTLGNMCDVNSKGSITMVRSRSDPATKKGPAITGVRVDHSARCHTCAI